MYFVTLTLRSKNSHLCKIYKRSSFELNVRYFFSHFFLKIRTLGRLKTLESWKCSNVRILLQISILQVILWNFYSVPSIRFIFLRFGKSCEHKLLFLFVNNDEITVFAEERFFCYRERLIFMLGTFYHLSSSAGSIFSKIKQNTFVLFISLSSGNKKKYIIYKEIKNIKKSWNSIKNWRIFIISTMSTIDSNQYQNSKIKISL